MKASRLIMLLAQHIEAHGDRDVIFYASGRNVHDTDITHCWHDYWEDDGAGRGVDRICLSGD